MSYLTLLTLLLWLFDFCYVEAFRLNHALFLSALHRQASLHNNNIMHTSNSDTSLSSTSDSTSTTIIEQKSAHLQLTQLLDHRDAEDIKPSSTAGDNDNDGLFLYEYVMRTTTTTAGEAVEQVQGNNITIMASLGTYASRTKLELYYQSLNTSEQLQNRSYFIRETKIDADDVAARALISSLWAQERLISQSRTPFETLRKGKESFNDTLFGYVRRMELLHEDLKSDALLADFVREQVLPHDTLAPLGLTALSFDPALNTTMQLARLKEIAVWFRSIFPYYYDGCLSCQNRDGNSFIGYILPNMDEKQFRAGRTELYSCGRCKSVTRFPRFNLLNKVLTTKRGRCGEYSMLMYRVLRLLGYTVRWVVDWADHVWVEARIRDKWVHVDPCEAAVDEPLIYQGWGKNQTYIMALSFTEGIEDVTSVYTTNMTAAIERREHAPSVIEDSVKEASLHLRTKCSLPLV